MRHLSAVSAWVQVRAMQGEELRTSSPESGITSPEGRMRTLEADIERACVDYMESDGWRSLKMEQQYSDKKRKAVGERGMPDRLFIRYTHWAGSDVKWGSASAWVRLPARFQIAYVLWVEFKRTTRNGKPTKPSAAQLAWHRRERALGALTVIAGIDFPATVEGFQQWYRESGLRRSVR